MIGHTSHLLLHVALASVFSLVALAALGVWRLSEGPIALSALTPHLEQSLSPADGGFRIDLDDTVLTWAGWDRKLDVKARDVRVLSSDGVALGTFGEVSFSLSLPALFRGIIAPTRLDIWEPNLRIIRGTDGRIAFDFGRALAESGEADTIERLLARLAGDVGADDPLRYLDRISIVSARMRVDDQLSETSWTAPRANIGIARSDDGLALELDVVVDLSGRPAHLEVEGRYRTESGATELDIRFTGLEPEAVAAAAPRLNALRRFDLPVSGRLRFSVGRQGEFGATAFELAAGTGRIALPDLYPEPLALTGAWLTGTYEPKEARLDVDEAKVDLDGLVLAGSGALTDPLSAPEIAMRVTADVLPIDRLLALWPPAYAKSGRSWVAENITAGRVTQINVRLDIEPESWRRAALPADVVSGDFEVEDLAVRYMDGMPAVTGLAAGGVFSGDRMDFVVRGGRVEGLALESGTVSLTGLGGPEETADIALLIRGAVPEVLSLINRPRLAFADRLGIDPAQTAGQSESRLKVNVPLVGGAPYESIDLSVKSTLAGARLPPRDKGGLLATVTISDADLTLEVDKTGMDARGRAVLSGVPMAVEWRENFGSDAPFARRFDIEGRLDDRDRERLGFGLPELAGPVGVRCRFTEFADGSGQGTASVDARDAAITVPPLLWEKARGIPASGRFEVAVAANGGAKISGFYVAAPEFLASGSASFGASGNSLKTLVIDQLRLGETEVSGAVHLETSGMIDVTLAGGKVDLRPYFEDRKPAVASADRVRIRADLEKVTIDEDRVVDRITGLVVLSGERIDTADLEAALDDRTTANLLVTPIDDRRQVMLTSDDAGGVARFFGIFDTMVGGRLQVRAEIADDLEGRPMTGVVTAHDFRVIDAPVLARLLSMAPPAGAVELMNGEGLTFTELRLPFVYREDEFVFTDGRVAGASLGLTAEGSVDMVDDTLAVRGTLVPAYALNTALGHIPILGDILTGGEGRGMFAATYRVTGPFDDPKVSVNPLAALAPGILREFFSMLGRNRDEDPPSAPTGPGRHPDGPLSQP